MLRSAAGRAKALPVNQERFERILSAIWWKGGNHPRLGLAISGGVDSMALASLCSRTTMHGKSRPSFTAFIVDHRLRQGSDIEAEKVARVLRQINIETHILKLDWTGITDRPDQLGNFETIARRLRFQALGKACKDSDIKSLLLAHHGDDQAETVLSRLVTGYSGFGFRGIQAESKIPECHGLYGVCESGSPYRLLPTALGSYSSPLQIESGGVHVHRPLLEFSKEELVATCNKNKVKWFEDPTNADRGLTLRNTIRHLWTNTQMPRALNPDAMIQMAQRVEERAEKRERAAEIFFNKCNIALDVRSGSLQVSFPPDLKNQLFAVSNTTELTTEVEYILALLLRRILALASPKQIISLQDLDVLAADVLQASSSEVGQKLQSTFTVSVASMSVSRQDSSKVLDTTSLDVEDPMTAVWEASQPSVFTDSLKTDISQTVSPPTQVYKIERERLKVRHQGSVKQILLEASQKRPSSTDLTWTDWKLFDGRFWLRLRYRPFNITQGHSIIVRFLDIRDLAALRRYIPPRDAAFLDRKLREAAPGKSRFTLPVILESYPVIDGSGGTKYQEDFCALPTIGWGKVGWRPVKYGDRSGTNDSSWHWECRYKMIEFGTGKGHSIKGPQMRRWKF